LDQAELAAASRSAAREGQGGGLRRVGAQGRVLHPHGRRPFHGTARVSGRPRVRHVPDQEYRRRDGAGLVLLCARGSGSDQDPVLLPEDGRSAHRSRLAPPKARSLILRAAARAIFEAALAAGDVRPLTLRALEGADPRPGGRLVVVGAGKASAAMAAAAEESLGDRISEGAVVVKDGYLAETHRVRLIEAGHPVPDERGAAGAREILRLVRGRSPGDLVLVLISGGGSALTPAPAPPVTLDDKQAVTKLLLATGATINELNAVRKHLSLLKGGQLARAAGPARVHALLLSDV